MLHLAFIVLTFSALGSAVPVAPHGPHGRNTTWHANEKRFPAWANCGLDMYPAITESPVKHAVAYLNGNDDGQSSPSPIFGDPSKCDLVSCSYGTGVTICTDPLPQGVVTPGQITYNPTTIAGNVEDTFSACFLRSPSDDSGALPAFQYWGTGYNVLVQGGYDC